MGDQLPESTQAQPTQSDLATWFKRAQEAYEIERGGASGFGSTNSLLASLYSQDALDISVQTGRSSKTRTRAGIDPAKVYIPGGTSPENAARILGQVTETYTGPDSKPLSDVLSNFYAMDPRQRQELQSAMYVAGFYGSRDLDEIAWGEPDDFSEKALTNLLLRTAKMNAAGEDVTWEEVLNEASGSDAALKRLADIASGKESGGGGGGGRTVQYYDPTYLASMLNEVARSTLGRRATVEEQRLFIGGFHAAQAGSTNIMSPPASAEEFLQQQNPAEFAGSSMARTFNNFVQLLGGIGK